MNSLTVIGTVGLEDIETPMGNSSPPPILGGSAIYASVAAQLLCAVDLIGIVGEDFPGPYLRCLQSLNIDLTGLQKTSGKTFYWKVKYAQDLLKRDALMLDLGVHEHYHPKLPTKCRGNKYALIANLMPQLQGEALSQLDSLGIVMMGTIEHWIRTERPLLESLLPRVNGFIANEEEMKLMLESTDPIASLKHAAGLGSEFSVMTLAERGATLVMGKKEFHFPAFPRVTIQDPTGAGDSFAGGLMASLVRDRVTEVSEQSLCRAMLYGTALASFCVEGFSIEGLCRVQLKDVERRVAILRRMVDFPT